MDFIRDEIINRVLSRKYKLKSYKLNKIPYEKFYEEVSKLRYTSEIMDDLEPFLVSNKSTLTGLYLLDPEYMPSSFLGTDTGEDLRALVEYGKGFQVIVRASFRKRVAQSDIDKEYNKMLLEPEIAERLEEYKDQEIIKALYLENLRSDAESRVYQSVKLTDLRMDESILILDKVTKRIYSEDDKEEAINLLSSLVEKMTNAKDENFSPIVSTTKLTSYEVSSILTQFFLSPFMNKGMEIGDKASLTASDLKVNASGGRTGELDVLFEEVLEGGKVKSLNISKNYSVETEKALNELEVSSADKREVDFHNVMLKTLFNACRTKHETARVDVTLKDSAPNMFSVRILSFQGMKKSELRALVEDNVSSAIYIILHSARMGYLLSNDVLSLGETLVSESK